MRNEDTFEQMFRQYYMCRSTGSDVSFFEFISLTFEHPARKNGVPLE